jgi:hypothetical protein
LTDTVTEESILETNPITYCGLFAPLEVDSFVTPKLELQHRGIEKGADKGIVTVHSQLMNVMGPLSQLWGTLEQLKDQEVAEKFCALNRKMGGNEHEVVVVDYDIGAWQAVREVNPGVAMIGCVFH